MIGILNFISESAYSEHKEYVNNQKLLFSILKKIEPALSELSLSGIESLRRIDINIRAEAISYFSEIRAHELYFSSFCGGIGRSSRVREQYGSEDSFLYGILKKSLAFGQGFCYVGMDRGRIFWDCTENPYKMLWGGEPMLVIDLCEHAYFRDFGHKREEYLRSALRFLDISRLE